MEDFISTIMVRYRTVCYVLPAGPGIVCFERFSSYVHTDAPAPPLNARMREKVQNGNNIVYYFIDVNMIVLKKYLLAI